MKTIACSKRSDSGERCEVKKAMKSRGGLGREAFIFSRSFLFAPLPTIWTPGTGYENDSSKTTRNNNNTRISLPSMAVFIGRSTGQRCAHNQKWSMFIMRKINSG